MAISVIRNLPQRSREKRMIFEPAMLPGNCRRSPAATAEDIMHTDHHSFSRKLTRRGLVAGAAAGTLTLASNPVSAQRCPAVPPVRAKGPPGWLDLDQPDLDDAHDQDVHAFQARNIHERRRANNQKAPPGMRT